MKKGFFALTVLVLALGIPLVVPAFTDEKERDAWLAKGVDAVRAGDYSSAIAACTRAIEIGPVTAALYRARGVAYLNSEQYDLAILDETKAIGLDPQDYYAYYFRAQAYKNTWKLDLALADINKALLLNPEFTDTVSIKEKIRDAWLVKGWDAFDASDYPSALAAAAKAIEIGPDIGELYHLRGASYLDSGQYDMAILDLTKSIGLDPKNAYAYKFRARAYQGAGKLDLALTDINKSLSLNPTQAGAIAVKEEIVKALTGEGEAKPKYAERHTVPVKSAADKAALAVLKKWDKAGYGKDVSWHIHIENNDGAATVGGVAVRFSAGSEVHTVLSVELPITLTQELVTVAKGQGLKVSRNTTTAFVVWLGKFAGAHLWGMEIGKLYEGNAKILTSDSSAMTAAVRLTAAAANDDLDGLGALLEAYSASKRK